MRFSFVRIEYFFASDRFLAVFRIYPNNMNVHVDVFGIFGKWHRMQENCVCKSIRICIFKLLYTVDPCTQSSMEVVNVE